MRKRFITPILVVLASLIFALVGATPASALRNGEKLCNSGSSDAAFVIFLNGMGYSATETVWPGDCHTLNAGDYSPGNLRIDIFDISSFRVRNTTTSGPYGSCQSTGSDREKVLHPGEHSRVTFLLYNRSGCKH